MRLIDADELIKDRVGNDPVVIAAKCTPTAYDVDKIVTRLEDERNTMHREDGSLMSARTNMSIDKAVDIVKSGGIAEEKKGEWKDHFTSRFGRIE